jgi:glycerol uptake facilitator-like aquaporin
MNITKYLVEFTGSLIFAFTIFAYKNPYINAIALIILVLFTGSYTYFNPAITFAFYSAGDLTKNDLMPYLLAQVLGGLAGYEIYSFVKN